MKTSLKLFCNLKAEYPDENIIYKVQSKGNEKIYKLKKI